MISGHTIMGEKATREVWVCGPGSYVVLKALAFDLRGENKDAYDLFYLLRNYNGGAADVAAGLRALLPDPDAERALTVLGRDFLEHDAVGPRRVAEFLTGSSEDTIQADVVGFTAEVLRLIEGARPRDSIARRPAGRRR